jgi:hypothetical protein
MRWADFLNAQRIARRLPKAERNCDPELGGGNGPLELLLSFSFLSG